MHIYSIVYVLVYTYIVFVRSCESMQHDHTISPKMRKPEERRDSSVHYRFSFGYIYICIFPIYTYVYSHPHRLPIHPHRTRSVYPSRSVAIICTMLIIAPTIYYYIATHTYILTKAVAERTPDSTTNSAHGVCAFYSVAKH